MTVELRKVPVEGFIGLYEVDNFGRIFSVERWVDNSKTGKQFVPGVERKLSLTTFGYLTVRLSKHGHVSTHRVNRLVAKAFLDEPSDPSLLVNHKDGIKNNNNITNLEWCTSAQNSKHACESGLMDFVGFKNPMSKFTQEKLEQVRLRVAAGKSIQDVALEFEVNRNTIGKALDREYGRGWRQHQKPQYSNKVKGIT